MHTLPPEKLLEALQSLDDDEIHQIAAAALLRATQAGLWDTLVAFDAEASYSQRAALINLVAQFYEEVRK